MTGTWQGLGNQPTFYTSTMILLTDGRVMVQEEATPHWHALTPDSNGSYVNGTWSTLADMSFWRRYYASGVLKDGRVILIGGEQSGDVGDTNKGEIYDPVSDSWSPIPSPPGWPQVGDATCCVLPDGRFMIGALTSSLCIIYDPSTNSWSPAASKAIRSNEETWILLPDNTIVTAQCFAPYQSEKYIISSNTWKNEGALPVTVVDPVMHEIGPAMLMYNGDVIFFGAANIRRHGKTVIYTPPASPTGTGTWKAGPDIPLVGGQTIVCNDCPASLLPNGKVLFASANYLLNDWGSPILIFEYDPASNTISQAPTPANNAAQVYWSRFMLLPTGQVLFSPGSNDIQCYTPDGGPQEAWRPTISAVIPHGTQFFTDYYLLKGTQLTGLSQANIYGDDCNPSTNYPLVRLQNTLTNNVYYCRTYDFSTRGVATGASLQSVRFNAQNIPYGSYDLCVIANGISSHCISFCHHRPKRPCGCDSRSKRGLEGCGREDCEELCCEDLVIDPEILELKEQLKRLQRNVYRLSSLIKIEEQVREPKETRKVEIEEDEK
jgi:Kelch motif